MHDLPRRLAPGALLMLAGAGLAGGESLFPAVIDLGDLLPVNGGAPALGFVIEGAVAGGEAGTTVAPAGDLDDDGDCDLLIAVPRTSPALIYAVLNHPALGITTSFSLSEASGARGFPLVGQSMFDETGRSMARVGDINADGIDDYIIGVPKADPDDKPAAGIAYVVYGNQTVPASIVLSSLQPSEGFRIHGAARSDYCGHAVSSAGDINGDGFDDLIVGAPNVRPTPDEVTGEAYVLFGGPGVGASGIVRVAELDGGAGFALRSGGTSLGFDVAGAGDFNADGIDDVMVSELGGAGKVFVVFGAPGIGSSGLIDLSSLGAAQGLVIESASPSYQAGHAIASLGDFNGDGVDDIAIGARLARPNDLYAAGQCFVVFGAPGIGAAGPIQLTSLDGSDGFVVNGAIAGGRLGHDVAGADVKHDAWGDLIMGAPHASFSGTQAGAAYVVFGGPSVGASGVIEVADLDGENGFAMHGARPVDLTGGSVASACDINGDGRGDVIISAERGDVLGSNDDSGRAFVIFGRACPDLDGDSVTSVFDFTLFAGAFGSRPGDPSWNSAADFNADLVVDVLDFAEFAARFGCGARIVISGDRT